MTSCACSIFFDISTEELAERYQAIAEPADGYLTELRQQVMLVDATTCELADWVRQVELAALLSAEDKLAISIFIVGKHWALALARDGKPGPVAAYTPDNPKTMEELPYKLLAFEEALDEIFQDDINREELDALFGALLEGVLPAEEVIHQLLLMLEIPADWLRWSWYETIPEQLFLDPDLANRVTPLGDARALWAE